MANEFDPRVGQWYSRRDKSGMFRVVAFDDETVELQNFEGDIEELDTDGWRALDIELSEAPENWTGPFDDIEADDLGDAGATLLQSNWREDPEPLRSEEEPWLDMRPPDERAEDDSTSEPAESSQLSDSDLEQAKKDGARSR